LEYFAPSAAAAALTGARVVSLLLCTIFVWGLSSFQKPVLAYSILFYTILYYSSPLSALFLC
jgi:hypothetical protein